MYAIARKSVVRFILDSIAELPASAMPVEYLDWDAHGETQELPNADLIGAIGFAYTERDKFCDIVFGIGMVTFTDPNILRLTDYADFFSKRLQAESTFPAYDPVTGDRIGMITVFDGTTVTPINRVEIRPALSLQASARLVLDTSAEETP